MMIETETFMVVSLMFAVFAAVAAVGTSLVLGIGFERLRAGFEIVRKQSGFFSDAIHKLEEKVEIVDKQTSFFSSTIHELDQKVASVGEQASAFQSSMTTLTKKVDIVDKQTGFFSEAIHNLEKKMDTANEYEQRITEKLKNADNVELISTEKADALMSHTEDLLGQISGLTAQLKPSGENSEHYNQQHATLLHDHAGSIRFH